MRNPFRPNKFELHNRPLIWIAPIARRIMNESGSSFVAGARGSGKTSILKAVDSLEQTKNESLKGQIRPLRYGCVGVYMRVQDLFTQSFTGINWAALGVGPDGRVVEYTFLSSVIEAEAGNRLMRLMAEWRLSDIVQYRLGEAIDLVEGLAKQFPQIFENIDWRTGDPILAAADALLRHRKSLAINLMRGDGAALKGLLVEEPLELIHAIAACTLPIIERARRDRTSGPLNLKIAIDECDYLSSTQQIALNTLVRKTSSPVDFLLAYVDSSYDPTTTLFSTLSLSGADRHVYSLSYESEDDFADLCQAIVSYRLFYFRDLKTKGVSPEAAANVFPLNKKLGMFSVNDLIFNAVKDNASAKTLALISRAEVLRIKFDAFSQRSLISRKTLSELQFTGQSPPIYQQFIIERLGYDPEKNLTPEVRKQAFLATIRRKQRAAFLQVVLEAKKQKLPYYGKRVLLSLADSCVRDFLDIMAEIFDQEFANSKRSSLDRFLAADRQIGADVQRRGAEQASDNKFIGIEHRPSMEPGGKVEVPDREGQILTRLIDALGRLTHYLQVSPDGLRSISTAERGVFVVDLAVAKQIEELRGRNMNRLDAVLSRGIRENHIVADSTRLTRPRSDAAVEPTVLRFRLHRRFAPRYKFSYIGAVEDVVLPADAIIELVDISNEFSGEEWARRIAARLIPMGEASSGQRDLFLKGDVDE